MKEILRKCKGCNKICDRENLIKITKSKKTGEVKVNPNTHFVGKSVYVCKNENCIKELIKKKKLIREFKLTQEEVDFIIIDLKDYLNNPHQ